MQQQSGHHCVLTQVVPICWTSEWVIAVYMMPNRKSTSPEENYFNDLSRRPSIHSNRSTSPAMGIDAGGDGVPRPKRIACIICRKRKLKCDGYKPSCGTCSRLGHKCAYDEVRRKSGPKRGYVKELEARLGMRLKAFHYSTQLFGRLLT